MATSLSHHQFTSTDIGQPRLRGFLEAEDGGFAITAGGEDIWGFRDEFHFAYLVRDGDFDLTSKITHLTFADPYTKAGIMARGELTSDSQHVYFQVFPDNSKRNNNNGGYELQFRLKPSGPMKAIYPPTAVGKPPFPVAYPETWVRMKRQGDLFTGFFSPDGVSWWLYGELEARLPHRVFLGLAVTSHNVSALAKACFREVCEN